MVRVVPFVEECNNLQTDSVDKPSAYVSYKVRYCASAIYYRRYSAKKNFFFRSAIRDLGSTNGTYVDDVKIGVGEEKKVCRGTKIRFGKVETVVV